MIQFDRWSVSLDTANLVTIFDGVCSWTEDRSYSPSIVTFENGTFQRHSFSEATQIANTNVDDALYLGFCITYSSFGFDEKLSFSTSYLIEKTRGTFCFVLSPLSEGDCQIDKIYWPVPFEFNKQDKNWYSVLTLGQGSLVENGLDQEIIPSRRWELDSGYCFSRNSYMPWYGLVKERHGLIAMFLDSYDCGLEYVHPAGGCTTVIPSFLSELGSIGYRREMRVQLLEDCDYNDFCKIYRNHLKQSGELVLLQEKIARNPAVASLVGTALVHLDALHNYSSDSFDWQHGNIKQKKFWTTFAERSEDIEALHKMGLKSAYLHLDGWTRLGYDNQHPDTFPPNKEAGGVEGLKDLIRRTHACGYGFGIHDQYRDYFLDAPSYNSGMSIVNKQGQRVLCSLWEGGKQEFLCTRFSEEFVNRNFDLYQGAGLDLDGAYLDVFSCVVLDECYSKEHPMTRTQCKEARCRCFANVRSRMMAVQSEEGVAWAIPHLDFVHHMPYMQELRPNPDTWCGDPIGKTLGVPVPLSALVYHDSLVVPWTNEAKDCKGGAIAPLMAMIHGGIPYVYPDSDDGYIKLANIAIDLHRRVAFSEMVSHTYLDEDRTIHQTVFANGVTVVVDTSKGQYSIKDSTYEI